METSEIQKLIEKLEYAKESVRALLKDASASVDFHGIAYWASEVERLREVIKSKI